MLIAFKIRLYTCYEQPGYIVLKVLKVKYKEKNDDNK